MRKKIIKLISHPLFSGSAIMIVGSNSANFIAYIYHLVIGRLLGPTAYGELSAVLSILGLIFATLNFLGLVIVKFASSVKKNELPSIFVWFSKKGVVFGFLLSFLSLFLTPFLSNFLRIKRETFLLISPILFLSVISFVYRSFLQGLMRFRELIVVMNLDFIVRLIFGIFFIYLGLSSFGAILGIVFSTGISFLILRYFLRGYKFTKKPKPFNKVKEVLRYSTPVFFSTLATNSMFSSDVILVKHFLVPKEAGIYASISTLGKIIFFGAGPVGAVMFPMISKRHTEGKSTRNVFFLSLFLTVTISFFVLSIYWVAPKLAIKILYGEKFLEGARYLFLMGVFMSFFSVASLFLSYFLSINKTKAVYFVIISSLAQLFGIWFYHESIVSIIKVSIFSSLIFLAPLLIYFGYEDKKKT